MKFHKKLKKDKMLLIRLPLEFHKKLAEIAKKHNTSITAIINQMIEELLK